ARAATSRGSSPGTKPSPSAGSPASPFPTDSEDRHVPRSRAAPLSLRRDTYRPADRCLHPDHPVQRVRPGPAGAERLHPKPCPPRGVRGGEPTPERSEDMIVDQKDGRCRECDGTLLITDADDSTMSVECLNCGEQYEVETDAFGDGCMHYYPSV